MTEATPPAAAASPARTVRVGTRGSPLALIQARDFVARARAAAPDWAFEEQVIRTTGDATQTAGTRLAEIGGKGLFAKEIHEALADRRIDVAVHSLKDLETALPAGIALGCTLPREDPREALILGPGCTVPDPADPYACLPQGALIGTASVRRQAQLLHRRHDLQTMVLRGNVQTRLEKVARGEVSASLLAYAGLKRLGLADRAAMVLEIAVMLPAVCQGIVGVTVRADDTALLTLLAGIEDPGARLAATAERAMLGALDGSCRTPIGGHARLLAQGELELTGLVARADGSFLLARRRRGLVADAARIGADLGRALRLDSPRDIFA